MRMRFVEVWAQGIQVNYEEEAAIHLTRNAANATGGKFKPVQSTTWRSAQRLWFAGARD
jgi:hypothetical protein